MDEEFVKNLYDEYGLEEDFDKIDNDFFDMVWENIDFAALDEGEQIKGFG